MAESIAPAGDTAAPPIDRVPVKNSEPPPTEKIGALRWLRRNLFNSPLNSALTIVAFMLVAYWGASFVEWGILDAVWYTT
ncbi:MAG: hypothetical protein ACREF6_05830, partial [Alphaproteobacteria bacterium]